MDRIAVEAASWIAAAQKSEVGEAEGEDSGVESAISWQSFRFPP
jgi:hypothetical protein